VIDFDGFSITGDGIVVHGTGFTVRNGTVSKFILGVAMAAPYGVIDGPGNLVERMRIMDSLSVGVVGTSAVVRDSVLSGNGNTAIAVSDGSLVLNNRVVNNKSGIAVGTGSTVSGNVVYSNSLYGIKAICPSLVLGNTSTGQTYNLSLTGGGCTVDHNVAP
jgi:hypothetical protein